MARNDQYDVVIAGGSIAGCVLALCYARHNLRIAVLEQKAALADYKALCTHFVQPMALPVLQALGLDRALEGAGAVATKAAFWTPAGWIDPPEGYGTDASTAHAYNIERRILDPLLRERIAACDRIHLCLGHRITAMEPADGQWMVQAMAGQEPRTMKARLVVAADGRHSHVAQLLGNASESQENQRSALLGYFEGAPAPPCNRSLFILSEPERGFLYPLSSNRTLLAWYFPKSSAEEWQRKRTAFELDIKAYFRQFPGVPDLSRARLVSDVLGYVNYPNTVRKTHAQGVAFIGDAALSLDPLSGVGCGFAIVSASLLADATHGALRDGSELEPRLAAYESEFNRVILPHAPGIRADSMLAKSEEISLQTYRCIASSATLQKQFVDLTGRVISPVSFQRAFASAMIKAQVAALKSKADNSKGATAVRSESAMALPGGELMRVAFTTFAILKQPYGNPEVQEFDDRTPDVFREAEKSPGFVARAVEVSGSELSNFERDWGPWGKFAVPRFYTFGRETNTDQRASTLSIWEDLGSVLRFVYSGLHLEALKKRSEWFVKPQWPTYALWWIPHDSIPTWQEACEKLEKLHDQGPSPDTFDFKTCFDANGNRVELPRIKQEHEHHAVYSKESGIRVAE